MKTATLTMLAVYATNEQSPFKILTQHSTKSVQRQKTTPALMSICNNSVQFL